MEKKIIDSIDITNLEVMTDTGWVGIDKLHKTIKYQIYIVQTTSFQIECADRHIVFDNMMREVYVENLSIGDMIWTELGLESIISIEKLDKSTHMFDLELCEESNRRYYTNGILSHNTLFLNALAKDYMESHLNVIYITLEISELQIVKRLDAMTSQFSPNELLFNSKHLIKKLTELRDSTEGHLFIKEYPTGAINVNNIRNYINDLVLQTGIKPDVIFVDYMDLMRPSVKINLSDSYTALKYISEDLRALAIEWNVIVWSASQIQRGHYDTKADQDLGMAAGATSIAKSETTDLLFSISQDEVLESKDIVKGFVAKCRYARPHKNIVFSVNYDYLDVSEHSIMDKHPNGMTKADIMSGFYGKTKLKSGKVDTIPDSNQIEQFKNLNEICDIFD